MPSSRLHNLRFVGAIWLIAMLCSAWADKAQAQVPSGVDAFGLCGLLSRHSMMGHSEDGSPLPTVCARQTISASTTDGFTYHIRPSGMISTQHFRALRKAANGSPISRSDELPQAEGFKIDALPVNEPDSETPDFWTRFHQKYGAGSGYFVISHPVTNASKSKIAFFIAYHCVGLCGYAGLGTFEWRHGEWQPGEIRFYWKR